MIASERVKHQTITRQKVAKRVPATKRMRKAVDWTGRLWMFASVLALLSVAGGLVMLYRSAAASPAFRLNSVEVSGTRRVSLQEVERIARQHSSSPLMLASLETLKAELKKIPWIKEAQVTRILPDKLRIKIEERTPLMLARIDQSKAYWVDEEAVVLGEFDASLDKEVPPIVVGLTSKDTEAAQAENRERVSVYKNLLWALDSGKLKYSKQVEEIDLANLKDVRLTMTQGARPVEIALGNRDFRTRFLLAIDVLEALKNQDSAKLKNYQILDANILQNPALISFISVVHPTQVAIRLAKRPSVDMAVTTEQTAFKAVPEKPSEKQSLERKTEVAAVVEKRQSEKQPVKPQPALKKPEADSRKIQTAKVGSTRPRRVED